MYLTEKICPVCTENKLTLSIIPCSQAIYPTQAMVTKYSLLSKMYFVKAKGLKAVFHCSDCGVGQTKYLFSHLSTKKEDTLALIDQKINTIVDKTQMPYLQELISQHIHQFEAKTEEVFTHFESLSEKDKLSMIQQLKVKQLRRYQKFEKDFKQYSKGFTVSDVSVMGNLTLQWDASHGFGNTYIIADENGTHIESEGMSKQFVLSAMKHVIHNALMNVREDKYKGENLLLQDKCDRIKIQLADAIMTNQPIGKINKLKQKIQTYQALLSKKEAK